MLRALVDISSEVVQIPVRSKLTTPGPPSSNGRERWSASFARAQMRWAEIHRGSEHRLQIFQAMCMHRVRI